MSAREVSGNDETGEPTHRRGRAQSWPCSARSASRSTTATRSDEAETAPIRTKVERQMDEHLPLLASQMPNALGMLVEHTVDDEQRLLVTGADGPDRQKLPNGMRPLGQSIAGLHLAPTGRQPALQMVWHVPDKHLRWPCTSCLPQSSSASEVSRSAEGERVDGPW